MSQIAKRKGRPCLVAPFLFPCTFELKMGFSQRDPSSNLRLLEGEPTTCGLSPCHLELKVGFEPTTCGLRNRCSTAELLQQLEFSSLFTPAFGGDSQIGSEHNFTSFVKFSQFGRNRCSAKKTADRSTAACPDALCREATSANTYTIYAKRKTRATDFPRFGLTFATYCQILSQAVRQV